MSHRRSLLRRWGTMVLAAMLPLAVAAVGFGDIVTLTPDATTKGATGGVVRGTVTSESPQKVEVKLGTSTTSIPTNEVAAISYDGQPVSLDEARKKEAADALPEAADLYKKAATDAASKPFIAEDAAFGQTRVLAEMAIVDASKTGEAIAALESFTRTYKAGRHIGPALESLAKLQLARENYGAVEPILAQMAPLPKGDERAAFYRVKILTRKGQLDQAVAELNKVIAGAADGTSRKRDALLAKAEALAGLKKFAEAEETVRGVIRSASPEDVTTQAAAHNTLGDCLRAAGKPKDAVYAYLHTDLLFSNDKEQHARALGQLARLWRDPQVNRPDRADETIERLNKQYPRSPFNTGAGSQ